MASAGIQRRILASHLALLLGVLVPATVWLGMHVASDARAALRESLAREGRALAAELDRAWPSDVPSWAAAIGAATGARLTLVALDGRVLGDSEVDAARLGALENHADRPEVKAALAGGEGADARRSTTLGRELLYVAVPVGSPPRAALRLALPLDRVRDGARRAQRVVWATGLLALLPALLVAGWSARRLGRPIVAMTAAARAMADGAYQTPLPPAGSDETGDLVRALGTLRDQLVARLDELRSEGEKMRTILDGMSEGVALVQDGVFTVANPAFRRLLDAGPVEGRRPLEAVRVPELAAAIERASGARATSPVVETAPELQVGGRTLTLGVQPLGDGTQGQCVVVLLDVTDARRLDRVRRDFVANASHELRTPVAAVLAAADTLAAGAAEDPDARATFLPILVRHAQRLSRLAADLLDLSRLEAGYRPRIEAVALPTALAPVVAALAPRAEEKRITVSTRLPRDLPPVAAERAAVEQIVSNLLDNAIKYTPEGGRVTVSGALRDRAVEIAISDTGPGIPAHHLGRLFERFYRVDSARSRELGGTGLGLAIVKHLAIALGGSARVESTVGEGSTFVVTLPRA